MDIGFQLKDYVQSLARVSFDGENENVSLIEETGDAYNFDSITKCVCKKVRGGNLLASCDALAIVDGAYYLIEFKNQLQSKIDRSDILKKAYDSVSTIRMIIDPSISLEDFVEKATLLVVFKNEEIPGFPHFKKKLHGLADRNETEPILFGLANIKGKLYKDIHTICKQDFIDQWYPKIWKVGECEAPTS